MLMQPLLSASGHSPFKTKQNLCREIEHLMSQIDVMPTETEGSGIMARAASPELQAMINMLMAVQRKDPDAFQKQFGFRAKNCRALLLQVMARPWSSESWI